jgi:5-methylcytosine-specific restriction endonuclease McrA
LGKWSSKQEYNEYMRVYMAGRYEKRRSQAIEDLGGKCAECGSGDDLEIDHINPREKSFNLAKAVGFSKKRWDEEVSIRMGADAIPVRPRLPRSEGCTRGRIGRD